MRRTLRIAVIVLLVPLSLALMAGIVFAVDRATNGGEVLGDVTVGGVALGGLDEADALAEVRALEDRLSSSPIPVTAAGRSFELVPTDIGFDIDELSIVDAAMVEGREGPLTTQFSWWIDHFGAESVDLDIPYTYDRDALTSLIRDWEVEGIDDPATPGSLRVEGLAVVAEFPRAGTGIEVEPAADAIAATLLDRARPSVELPTREIVPELDPAELQAVATDLTGLISTPVTLVNDEYGAIIEVPPIVLAQSLHVGVDASASPPSIKTAWRFGPARDFLERVSPVYETTPANAEWYIDEDDQVIIVPSVPVLEPDSTVISQRLRAALAADDRSADIPFRVVREADVSTAEVEALGIREKISEFTTFHNCCENRVINIQLIADAVDGAMVAPGETWSLNDHVGQRTAAKGYVPAGAIIGGVVECCDSPINIGGGTSQFTTTMYNAIFFAGLEDIDHTPHTIWFSRYPEGREATLGFPAPDLVFRNNTENWVYIDTSHTDTSITVKMFGDNGGIEVEAGLSERYDFTGIRETVEYTTDVAPGEERLVASGSGGWAVDIYRYITYPDGETTTEEWTWRYTGEFRKYERHPCSRNNTCDELIEETTDE
jgi:hypothetical protein